MSIHTGRIGTPPHKSRLHIENNMLLAIFVLVVAALVFVWLIGLANQYMNVNATPRLTAGQMALYEQRVGEWSAGAPALTMGSQSLYEQRAGEWSVGVPAKIMGSHSLYAQRVGEWSVGQTQPVSIPQMKLDTARLNRLAQARAYGIR
jgi:hypothetical protein